MRIVIKLRSLLRLHLHHINLLGFIQSSIKCRCLNIRVLTICRIRTHNKYGNRLICACYVSYLESHLLVSLDCQQIHWFLSPFPYYTVFIFNFRRTVIHKFRPSPCIHSANGVRSFESKYGISSHNDFNFLETLKT